MAFSTPLFFLFLFLIPYIKGQEEEVVWSWVGGINSTTDGGFYGEVTIPSDITRPPPRLASGHWNFVLEDGIHYLLLYSGITVSRFTDSTGNGFFNDVWLYNTSSNQWSWLAGSNITSPSPILSDNTTHPGSRAYPLTWKVGSRFYLQGGSQQFFGATFYYSDIWYFDLSSRNWTLVQGSNPIRNCNSTTSNVGAIGGGALWEVGEEDYFYGGRNTADFYRDGILWKWNETVTRWQCFGRQYNATPSQDTAGLSTFRNFTESPLLNVYPRTAPIPSFWVYHDFLENDTLLITSSSPGVQITLYGFSFKYNAWAWIYTTTTSTPSPSNPGSILTAAQDRFTWTDPISQNLLYYGATFSNALYSYNYPNNTWSILSGTLTTVPAVYGPRGVASSTFTPGSKTFGYIIGPKITPTPLTSSAKQVSPYPLVPCWIAMGAFLNATSFFFDVNDVWQVSSIPISPPISPEPISPPIQEPVSSPIQEPIAEPVESPIAEPVESPIQEPPVLEPISEPVSEPISEPVSEPIQEPISEPIQEPVSEPIQEPVSEPVLEPVEEPPLSPPLPSCCKKSSNAARRRPFFLSEE